MKQFLNKSLLFRVISYLVIGAIFVFMAAYLIKNFNEIKNYHFSLDYLYLFIALVFFCLSVVLSALIWEKIIRILEPGSAISRFKFFKIFIYSTPAKYLPGKIWMFTCKPYLGNREGIGVKALTISIIYEIFLSTIAGFLLSLFLLGLFLKNMFSGFYLTTFLVIGLSLILIHPKVFYKLVNFTLTKFRREPINRDQFLNEKNLLKFIFYYLFVYILMGIGFFFLVRSITVFPLKNITLMIGGHTLATVLGTLAIFAPAGLGVKEGALIAFLNFYFPLGMAIFISLLTRILTTASEFIPFLLVVALTRFRKNQ